MRNIQYCHKRLYYNDPFSENFQQFKAKGGRTVVMEKITLQEFEAAVPTLNEPAFVLKVGVAVCGKKDNYCKKTGRELAVSRMKEYKLFVTCKSDDTLQLYNAYLGITLFLKKSKVTDDINFVDIL